MGQKILTPSQLNFLELAQTDTYIVKNYYLTGGTALAAFYYQHRLSEDIDLFCEKMEINPNLTDVFLQKYSRKLNITKIKRSQILGLVSYLLSFKNQRDLKVDFNYYPFPRIEKGSNFNKLSIDSIYDIAVNKVHTLFMKPRIRDYIDLYFIFKTERNYDLENLIIDAKIKFDWHIDRVNLSSQFLRISDLLKTKELPKMLVPFDPKDMEKLYLRLAKSLEKEIFN